tara:strand:- start:55 stop:219 length:165 start_codon:yes stop_codon:yes gene_type:complete
MSDDEKLLLKVFDCLIYTTKNFTDLENVYSADESVSWAEVYKAKAYLHQLEDEQ